MDDYKKADDLFEKDEDDYVEMQTRRLIRRIRTMLDWHGAGFLAHSEAVCRMKMLHLVSDLMFGVFNHTSSPPKDWQEQLYPKLKEEVDCD